MSLRMNVTQSWSFTLFKEQRITKCKLAIALELPAVTTVIEGNKASGASLAEVPRCRGMQLAELLLVVRRAAEGYPRSETAELAVTTLIAIAVIPGAEGAVVRRVLRGFVGGGEDSYSAADFRTLQPLALGALDRLLEALLDGTYSDAALAWALQPLFRGRTH